MIIYSQILDAVIADLVRTIPLFSHIDPARLLAVAANRTTNGRSGALAECMALGLPEKPAVEFSYDAISRRITAATPWFTPRNRRVIIRGVRMLYVLRFRLPRFLNHSPVRSTIHELLHISEKFDGAHRSLRHGTWFERYVRMIERDWRRKGDARLISVLDMNYRELQREYGSIVCRAFKEPFKTPWCLPCENPPSLAEHPEIQRLGLKFGPGAVRRLPFEFDDPSGLRQTERDLEFRIFTTRGSGRIPAELLPSQALRPYGRGRSFFIQQD